MRRPDTYPLFWDKVHGFDYSLYSRLQAEAEHFQLYKLRDWIKDKECIRAIEVMSGRQKRRRCPATGEYPFQSPMITASTTPSIPYGRAKSLSTSILPSYQRLKSVPSASMSMSRTCFSVLQGAGTDSTDSGGVTMTEGARKWWSWCRSV